MSKKITELNALTTPDGDDSLVVVDTSAVTTKKTTLQGINRYIAAAGVLDASGNELVKFSATASAVNEVTVTNKGTGAAPSVAATGDDTNVGLNLVSKGTGEVQINGVGMSGAWKAWVPTHGGFSAAPTGGLYYYTQVGKTVTLTIREATNGTSNGSTFTISLPVTAVTRTNARWGAPLSAINNGGDLTTPGLASIVSGGTVVNLYTTWLGAGWTSSGSKACRDLTMIYEAA